MTDEELRKQLVEDTIFLNGVFVACCPDMETRRLVTFGLLKLRAYLEGNLSENADEASMTEELMRSYQ